MQKYLNKENVLSVLFLVILAIAASYLYFYHVDTVFKPVYNIIWGVFNLIVISLIFITANFIYFKTNDKRMAAIAAGFFAGGVFEFIHASNSFNVISIQYMYFFFQALSYITAIYLTVFYVNEPIAKKPKNFLIKMYSGFFLYLVIVNFIMLLFGVKNVALFFSTVPIQCAFAALFLLGAFLCFDLRKNVKLRPFCFFVFALILYASGEIYVHSAPSAIAKYRFIGHITDMGGHIFMLLGLKDILFKVAIVTLRQKMVLFQTISVTLLYVSLVMFVHVFLGLSFPIYIQYVFLFIISTLAYVQYVLADKFTLPLRYLFSEVEKYTPEKEPTEIPVTSNDEVSILTSQFNKNAELIWKYVQEINKRAEREALLKQITEIMRSSLDIEETLEFICEETAKLFNVQRSAIAVFPDPENYEDYHIRKEYKSSPDIKGFTQGEHSPQAAAYWGEHLVKSGNIVAIDNIQESETPDYFKNTYASIGVKSIIGASIRKGIDIWGTLVLAENNKYRSWSEEEKTLLKTIANQLYIAINQAELYEETKQNAKRESLLRNIFEAIRSSLDINVIKKIVVTEVGKALNADRCYFRFYDKKENKFLAPDVEYLSSNEIPSMLNELPDQDALKYFPEMLKDRKKGLYPVVLDESSAKDDIIRKYFKRYTIKADYVLPIVDREDDLTCLVLHYSKQDPKFNEDDKKMLETIANQVVIALEQAKLYNITQVQAEAEKFNRKIMEILRDTQDRETIKYLFVKNIGEHFNADRVFFADYDPKLKKYLPIDKKSEYLSSEEEKSFVGYDWAEVSFRDYIQPLLEKRELKILCWDEYIQNNPNNSGFISRFEDANVKSSYNFPVLYEGKIMGYFCIEFTKNGCKKLSNDDILRIRNLCSQAGIALYHADLFLQVQKSAYMKGKFITDLANESKVILNDIVELSESMTTTEVKCDKHIEHLRQINENVKQLLAFTNSIIDQSVSDKN